LCSQIVTSFYVAIPVLNFCNNFSQCRKWKSEQDGNEVTQPFEDWVRAFAQQEPLDLTDPENKDRLLLSTKPSQRATRYTRMKAFANHFRVEDSASAYLRTYDSGVASIFQEPTADAAHVSMNYVGVLKDILKLDYRPLHSPVILLRCE
jgi:hypothetical protein